MLDQQNKMMVVCFLCLHCTQAKWKCGSWDFICFNRDLLPYDENHNDVDVFLVHKRYISMDILINRRFCVRLSRKKKESFLVDTFSRLGFACCLQWVVFENPVDWTRIFCLLTNHPCAICCSPLILPFSKMADFV